MANSKHIVIVGVGALGSHAVQFLRNVGATIKVIDFDRVETKNVSAQFHAKGSTGKTKVLALQQTMNFLFGTKMEAVPHKLTQENVKELLGNADLVIDALDNAAGRCIIQNYVRASGTPCLHGALAPGGEFGRVVWDESFVIDSEVGMGVATCEGGEHLPFIGIVSSFLAQAAQEFLVKGKKVGYEISQKSVFCT